MAFPLSGVNIWQWGSCHSCRKHLSDLVLGTPPCFEVALIMFFIFLFAKKNQNKQIKTDYDGVDDLLTAFITFFLFFKLCFRPFVSFAFVFLLCRLISCLIFMTLPAVSWFFLCSYFLLTLLILIHVHAAHSVCMFYFIYFLCVCCYLAFTTS